MTEYRVVDLATKNTLSLETTLSELVKEGFSIITMNNDFLILGRERGW